LYCTTKQNFTKYYFIISCVFTTKNNATNSNKTSKVSYYSSTTQYVQLGSSETTRVDCFKNEIDFNYWLAGVIDGDGCLLVSKNNYTSCEITVAIHEYQIIAKIKHKLGGSITKRTKAQAYRWRLHNKIGMQNLIERINGKILIAKREAQLKNVCETLQIKFLANNYFQPVQKRSFCNYWLAGFFDAEGYFNVNRNNFQCSITLSQKTPEILQNIARFFGGNVHFCKSWNGYLYESSASEDVNLWFQYFARYKLKSPKALTLVKFKRILLFKKRHYIRDKNLRIRFLRLIKTITALFLP